MEAYKQITLDEWTQWKEDIRKKLAETANNFVYIGYRLKQIRDSGMFGGAADVFEFAQNEYGLGKSTVSRFIAINEKYSEGGNSLELKEEFKNFSSSKLSEMLTLPDNEIQMITESTTIKAIRELKKFDAEDPEVVQAEEREAGAEHVERTPLEKCLIDFFKLRKEMLNGIIRYLEAEPPEYKEAADLMAPSQTSHKKGIVFLFLYDWSTGIKYKLMTKPEPVSMSWTELLDIIYGIFGACEQADAWEAFYGEAKGQQEDAGKEVENSALIESNQGIEAVATSQQEGKTEPPEKPEESEEEPPVEGQQETEEQRAEKSSIEDQEAAGSEIEGKREGREHEEDSTDGGTDQEPPADAESGDHDDGTGGGCRETGAGSTTSGGEIKREENEIRNQYGEVYIRTMLGTIEQYVEEKNWKGVMEKAQEIFETAQEILKRTKEV